LLTWDALDNQMYRAISGAQNGDNASTKSSYVWAATGGQILSQGSATTTLRWSPTATKYALSVTETDRQGCTGPIFSLQIPYDSSLQIPNIITPNGDGKNDAFAPINLRFHPGSTLTIYSRWGKALLSIQNPENNFQATSTLPPATYFYTLKLPNSPPTLQKGWLEVVR
jgi:gliding motility-associated-like protein